MAKGRDDTWRAADQDQTVLREAVGLDQFAIRAARVANLPTLSQHVKYALFELGDVHSIAC